MDQIQQITHELLRHQNILRCKHCSKSDQFLSHGFIYKSTYSDIGIIKVGKRIFCSNRYKKKGCGRTLALIIAGELPKKQYNSSHLMLFIRYLIQFFSVREAYKKATRTNNPRNAYRWLNALEANLLSYRSFLKRPTESPPKRRNKRLTLLTSTLKALFTLSDFRTCSEFHLSSQRSFI